MVYDNSGLPCLKKEPTRFINYLYIQTSRNTVPLYLIPTTLQQGISPKGIKRS